MNACAVTSSASSTPSRTGRADRVSTSTRHTMNGSRNWLMMFGCQLACDSMAGENPQNQAATAAAGRCRIRCRDSTRYQAAAVPARPSVTSVTKETAGPNRRVTGTIGMPSARMAVFAIRLTPSG